MKALIIEDDKDISRSITYFLKEKNIISDCAFDGELGLNKASSQKYDFIILDYNLPGLSGLEIIKELRKEKNSIPIIITTIRSEIDDKIKLLESGADDYVIKPFSFNELLARIKAVTRRPKQIKASYLKIKNIKLYPDKFIAQKNGKNIKLRAKEFSLLEYLLNNRGSYVTRQDIMENVWDENADPFSNTIEVHIMKLRKKIEDNNNRLIYTLSNRGYKIDEKE